MVEYEVEGARATITINEPDRRNPLSTATMAALVERTREAVADDSVRVLVYTGAGDRAFSAGGDLSSGFVDDPIGLHSARGAMADLFRAMWGGGKPTVARVNGHALAGGFGLAVACDVTVAADDVKLGMPEIKVGLWPMMITVAVQRAMPPKAALELMMTGRLLEAEEALALGAVSRMVPRERLDDEVDEVVAALAAHSSAVMMLGRDAFYAVQGLDADTALDRLQSGLTAIALTEDSREGVQAFLEKRDPVWRGR
ncbi:MAG TPA: enoyl-CoA hydratase-related protein [Acidimicrobiia bacterium]|nr:enoyl-CoA hydratase-related protein [Acidimicrobiia bacterium]